QVSDLHRLGARASTGRASPRDLAAVARTLRLLPDVHARLADCRAGLLCELRRHLDTCPDLCAALDAALVEAPPADSHAGELIRGGHDERLDQFRETARSGKEWLARFQAEEAVRSGITGIKVGYNQVFGYYLEVGHAH